MSKRTTLRVLVVVALAIQLIVGLTLAAPEVTAAGKCTKNNQGGCNDSGCATSGGICGQPFADPSGGKGSNALPAPDSCWCLYGT